MTEPSPDIIKWKRQQRGYLESACGNWRIIRHKVTDLWQAQLCTATGTRSLRNCDSIHDFGYLFCAKQRCCRELQAILDAVTEPRN